MRSFTVAFLLMFSSASSVACAPEAEIDGAAYSAIRPRIIRLDLPAGDEDIGGLITADVNGDGLRDFIITKPNHLAVHDHSGKKLWTKQIDIQIGGEAEWDGLPGWHGPGVQAGDVDGDGNTEVLYLTKDGALHIVDGSSGREKWTQRLEAPAGGERWEHLVVANFRGKGDRDLLLQATNAEGYRMGRYLAAYASDNLIKGELQPLCQRDDFVANAHNGARIADLDGDGKDEVLGGTVIGPDGKLLFRIPVEGHIDSIFVRDVVPEIAGLEVLALEEGGGRRIFSDNNFIFLMANRLLNRIFPGGNRVFVYNHERLIWQSHYNHQNRKTRQLVILIPTDQVSRCGAGAVMTHIRSPSFLTPVVA